MEILVDTSIWIDYFRSGENSDDLDILMDENLIVINDIILTELIPFLELRKKNKVIILLKAIKRLPLQIDWDGIIQLQVRCLKSGINGLGIPDLIIAQYSKQNNYKIYSLDKHFQLLEEIGGIKLYR